MKVPWYSIFSFLFLFFLILFYLEATVKRTLGWEQFSSRLQLWFQKSVILKITWYQLFSKFSTIMRHMDNEIWNTPYRLKILQIWINIRVNSFLDKYHETKMGENGKMPWKLLVAQKSEPVLSRTFARHFTYYYILLFLWNKPSFKYEPSVDRIILTEICLSYTFWYSVHIVKLLLSMKYTYLLTAKITPEVNKSNFTWCEGAIVVLMWLFDYLIWCLIMASTKLM